MKFNLYLKNHHVSGTNSLEDLIKPMSAALREGGHQVQIEYSYLMPRPWVNILFEYFPDERFIADLGAAKKERDLILGLVATEDMADTISMGAEGEQVRLNRLLAALPLFDFVWTVFLAEDYTKVMAHGMTASRMHFGFCPSLAAKPGGERNIDALLYGQLTPHRAQVIHSLLGRPCRVESTFGNRPEYVRADILSRSKMVLEIRRGDAVRFLSPSRIWAAVQAGGLVLAERFDVTEIADMYRFTVEVEHAAMAETCLDLLADPVRYERLARERQDRFAAETSMRDTMNRLIEGISV